jgi:outer membrane receptor protein involved in Fe transport
MKKTLHLSSVGLIAASSIAATMLSAQDASQQDDQKDIFELSPFVVESESQGYYDSSTLAGTRLKGQVRDVGAAIQVLTSEFMEDIDADSVNDLLLYTTSSEASGLGGNFTGAFATQGMGVNVQNTQNEPHRALRIRGIAPPDLTRDFFITDIPMDRYNTDRVTVNRGANSILFGLGSPAGIVNNTLKKAQLGSDAYQVQARLGNSGTGEDISWRVMGDFNVVVVDDKLAIRLALLEEEMNYMQQPAFKRDSRHYLTATARPFKGMTLRGYWEKGDMDANNPDPTGPYENISRYLEARDLIHEANGDTSLPLVGDSYAWGVREDGKTRYIWEGTPANGIIRTPNLFKTLTFISASRPDAAPGQCP